jgi:hypothetical protein
VTRPAAATPPHSDRAALTRAHRAITGWCTWELATRRQDHAAATYVPSTPAAVSYTAGAAPMELDLEITAADVARLAELAYDAEQRLERWSRTAWLAPHDYDLVLVWARATLAGAPDDRHAERADADATLQAFATLQAGGPRPEPPPRRPGSALSGAS